MANRIPGVKCENLTIESLWHILQVLPDGAIFFCKLKLKTDSLCHTKIEMSSFVQDRNVLLR